MVSPSVRIFNIYRKLGELAQAKGRMYCSFFVCANFQKIKKLGTLIHLKSFLCPKNKNFLLKSKNSKQNSRRWKNKKDIDSSGKIKQRISSRDVRKICQFSQKIYLAESHQDETIRLISSSSETTIMHSQYSHTRTRKK